eukprot:2091194-Prymnesium_polylepis.1
MSVGAPGVGEERVGRSAPGLPGSGVGGGLRRRGVGSVGRGARTIKNIKKSTSHRQGTGYGCVEPPRRRTS